jgi:hypothetical protein
VISGTGRTTVPAIVLPAGISIGHFRHDGRGTFSVQSFVGSQGELLITAVGSYDGYRPLFEGSPVQLSIEADGPWTVSIAAIICCSASGDFAGRGDAVSMQFNPPTRQTFDFTNEGQRAYVVYAHCRGGDQIVLDRVGAVRTTMAVQFGPGPCWWEILSDGSWSIKASH